MFPSAVPAAADVFLRFLRLGLTAFGGPVAHLGYFRREFVARARWLDDAAFGEIVALCSVLPGPTSSQVGMLLGASRAGPLGALAAWAGFTLPAALVLGGAGLAVRATGASVALRHGPAFAGALVGLAGAAAAVVLLATVALGRNLLGTPLRYAIAALACAGALELDRVAPALQWLPLVAGGALGAAFEGARKKLPRQAPLARVPYRVGVWAGAAFLVLLTGLPIVTDPGGYGGAFATFFRAGSLVFGGGHVVLPFLQSLVAEARIDGRTFLAGYGLAQATPGPLFAFAAFLGAAERGPGGAIGACVALAGIFAPSFLLLAAAVPLWTALRDVPRAPQALAGVGAAVVGLLAAVLADPIGTGIVREPRELLPGALALALLAPGRTPVWLAVVAAGVAGAVLHSGGG